MTVTALTLLALTALAVTISALFFSREQSALRPVRVRRDQRRRVRR